MTDSIGHVASVKKVTVGVALALCAALSGPPGAVAGQEPARQPSSVAALDSALEAARGEWKIPGMAIAVVRNDTVLLARGYGVRELGRPGGVDENTLFDAASLTKPFTSAAVAALVDEGRIRWDDPVRRYLPRLELATSYLTGEVTLRDLLSHRTGIERGDASWYSGISRMRTATRCSHGSGSYAPAYHFEPPWSTRTSGTRWQAPPRRRRPGRHGRSSSPRAFCARWA
jgi:CubicO group peptidase (beta-lactamase class C family)